MEKNPPEDYKYTLLEPISEEEEGETYEPPIPQRFDVCIDWYSSICFYFSGAK